MGIKILVVEDDRDLRRNMKVLLEGEGHIVTLAENGQIAIDHLKETNDLPALILLDLMMPVMDGFQFREAQEQSSKFGSIPIVVLTADGRIDEKQMRLGAVAALKKPVDIDAILSIIEKVIRRQQSQ